MNMPTQHQFPHACLRIFSASMYACKYACIPMCRPVLPSRPSRPRPAANLFRLDKCRAHALSAYGKLKRETTVLLATIPLVRRHWLSHPIPELDSSFASWDGQKKGPYVSVICSRLEVRCVFYPLAWYTASDYVLGGRVDLLRYAMGYNTLMAVTPTPAPKSPSSPALSTTLPLNPCHQFSM